MARGKRPPSLGKDVFYRSKVMLNDGFINAIGKIIFCLDSVGKMFVFTQKKE